MSNKYMVFDIESIGLHGVGFAYGYVVVSEEGDELECGYGAIKPRLTDSNEDDVAFLKEKVFPALFGWTHEEQNSGDWGKDYQVWKSFRTSFWDAWLRWKEQGAVLVTDCGWPVEANFLAACVADDVEARKWCGPYPLFDLSSVLLAVGKDPVGTFERKTGEAPAHNPLCDARQSARILIEVLNELAAKPNQAMALSA